MSAGPTIEGIAIRAGEKLPAQTGSPTQSGLSAVGEVHGDFEADAQICVSRFSPHNEYLVVIVKDTLIIGAGTPWPYGTLELKFSRNRRGLKYQSPGIRLTAPTGLQTPIE